MSIQAEQSALPDPKRVAAIERTALILSSLVIAIGAVVLAGWLLHIPALQRFSPRFMSMKGNTALALVLAGAALILATRRRGISTGLASVVILIGASTFMEYILGWSFGIDELLFTDPDRAAGPPGRMAPTTTVCLVLSGLAILLMAWRYVRWAHAIAITVFAIAFVAFLGYAFNVSMLFRISAYSSMALHTSVTFMLLATVVLATSPTAGLTAIFANHGAGGLLVRRVLPFAVILPILTGWAVALGEDAGLYDRRFAIALHVFAAVVLLSALIAGAAQQLFAIDQERRAAQHELQLLNVELEEQVAERTAELAGTEERFRSIAASAQDGILIADGGGDVIYTNPAGASLFGYDPDEIIGRPLTALMPDRFRDAHRAGLARYVETGEPIVIGKTVELSGRAKDGSEFPIELSLSQWTSEGRQYFSGYIRDITLRKQAERALALHASVVATSDDAIYTIDRASTVTSWNTGAERLYGYTTVQAIGRSISFLSTPETASDEVARLDRVMRSNIVEHRQTHQQTKDGSRVPVSLTISPLLDHDEQPTGASIIARDISELQRREDALTASEASYRMLTENVSDVIIRLDPAGVITYASPACLRVMGYTPAEMIGRTAADFMPPEAGAEVARLNESVFNLQTATTQQPVRRKDGTEVWLEGTSNPIVDATGTITGIIWVVRDVSGHVEALARQREIAERQEELNQLKSEFVGIVAHDLKSPMAVISGFADILADHWDITPDEEKISFLRRIRQNIRRLSDLVDDVLQVARIESGEMSFNVEPIDLGRIVRETIADMEETEPERTIRASIPEDLPPVLGDKERQWRILTNLLTNAVKFSDTGEPVEVTVTRNGDDVRVSVHDHGSGIEAEDIPKLFQRFARVKQAEGRRIKGTGLGLYICRSLVEGQGGRIWVDSTVDEGSTFHYTVPISADPL